MFIAAMPEPADGAADTLMQDVLSAFAEFERDMIASRVSDTRAGLVARGRRIAGVTPCGYTRGSKTKQHGPVASEAKIVSEYFRLNDDGVLPREIARAADEQGGKTRGGLPWTARQVLEMVADPF